MIQVLTVMRTGEGKTWEDPGADPGCLRYRETVPAGKQSGGD